MTDIRQALSGGGSGVVVGEAMSRALHNALIASCDQLIPPLLIDHKADCPLVGVEPALASCACFSDLAACLKAKEQADV